MKYGIIPILLGLSILQAAGQEIPSNSSQQTLLFCDQIEDGDLKTTCEQFHQALLEKHLVLPIGQSAYDHFLKLEQADPLPGLVLALRIKLTGALQQELGKALELAGRVPLTQSAVELVYGRDFAEYRMVAEKLATLSGKEEEGNTALLWPQWYFAGLDLREKARGVYSRDTSLLVPAIQMQVEAMRADHSAPHPHQETGSLFFDIKGYNQSKTFYLQANSLAPEWALPLIGLSQFLAKFNEEEAALAMAERAVGLQTDFAETYLNAARLNARFGRAQKSMDYYRLALEKMMTDIASGPEEYRWFSALRLSGLLVQFELYEQAAVLLKKILAKREVPEAYLLLGEVYEATNRKLSADSVYRRCIALWPEQAGAYLRGGALYLNLRQYALAQPFFEKAYELNPANREVCFNLGSIRHLHGESAAAELLYRQALAYPGALVQVLNRMDTMIIQMNTANRVGEAVGLLAPFNDPQLFFKANFPFAGPPASTYEDYIFANLGDLLYRQGRLGEAILLYRQALLLNPTLGEVYKNIIQCYYDTGDFQNVMTYIQLYQLYVPYSRETREDWKTMSQLSREINQKKVSLRSAEELAVYTSFMDNFWAYLYALNREDQGLGLDRTMLLRQQRLILQDLKKYQLEDKL